MVPRIPDIDFITSSWMDTASALLAHRGFTHSFLFIILLTPLLALWAEKKHRPHNISLAAWAWFFGLQLLLHVVLDACNVYGVGWFEPFSHYRVSFNILFVADPLFSIVPVIAFFILLILNYRHRMRRFWWRAGLLGSGIYLVYCITNKLVIENNAKKNFETQHIPHEEYFTTPAPFSNWLWYIVAGNDKGYYIGYRSVFDSKKEIEFHFFPKNEILLQDIADHESVQKLLRFSKGFYAVKKAKDKVIFNDLRFGQIMGWEDRNAEFVFHYFLQEPRHNKLVMQRGRLSGWNKKTIQSYLQRIRGN